MEIEVLKGIFPKEPEELKNTVGVIGLLKQDPQNRSKNDIVILAGMVRGWGNWGVRRTRLSVQRNYVPRIPMHPDHPNYSDYLKDAFPTVLVIYVGSAIEGLAQAERYGFFSTEGYLNRCRLALRDTNNGNAALLYPIEQPHNSVPYEDIQPQLRKDILGDRTFVNALMQRHLLPQILQEYLYQSQYAEEKSLHEVLGLYQPIARVILGLSQ